MQPLHRKLTTDKEIEQYAGQVTQPAVENILKSLANRRAQAVHEIDLEIKFYEKVLAIKLEQEQENDS